MNIVPNAPLFRDPIYDGAADPVIIWNKLEQSWWIFYTSRRATAITIGFSFMHGTDIGIASSKDGKVWLYRGIANGLAYEEGRNTYWAPEIIEHENTYHMYVSYVRGIPTNWDCPRSILHYTSKNLWDWKFESKLSLSSNRVIDSCVFPLVNGMWKMWYKDEVNNCHSYTAVSTDLYNWKVGSGEITDCSHEGPNVFHFEDYYWMITDPWEGLAVYRSADCTNWTRCSDIMKEGGCREDDGTIANHPDVLIHKGRAYIFYFTHPEVSISQRSDLNFNRSYKHRRTSLQVSELVVRSGELHCDRNNVKIDLSM